MGTKQPEQAIIGCRHRLSAGGRQAKECINLPHGLRFGRLWSHTSSGYAAPDAKSDTNLYDPGVPGTRISRVSCSSIISNTIPLGGDSSVMDALLTAIHRTCCQSQSPSKR